MPSEIKTPNIGLNKWAGNEYPKRQDFVDDNFIIDTEIGNLKKIAHGAVVDLAALKTIDTTNMFDNITIIVKSLGFYRFDRTSLLTPDDKAIIKPTVGVGRWINDLAAHQADLASQEVGKGASIIGLNDAGNKFIATNVEGALSELFQNVSNGKNLVGGAITDLDNSIVIPTDPTFLDLATAISNISTGKKYASGIFSNFVIGTQAEVYQYITNLSFIPNLIVAKFVSGGYTSYALIDKHLTPGSYIRYLPAITGIYIKNIDTFNNGGNVVIKSTVSQTTGTLEWIAIE